MFERSRKKRANSRAALAVRKQYLAEGAEPRLAVYRLAGHLGLPTVGRNAADIAIDLNCRPMNRRAHAFTEHLVALLVD